MSNISGIDAKYEKKADEFEDALRRENENSMARDGNLNTPAVNAKKPLPTGKYRGATPIEAIRKENAVKRGEPKVMRTNMIEETNKNISELKEREHAIEAQKTIQLNLIEERANDVTGELRKQVSALTDEIKRLNDNIDRIKAEATSAIKKQNAEFDSKIEDVVTMRLALEASLSTLLR